jgi:hypothetical protein
MPIIRVGHEAADLRCWPCPLRADGMVGRRLPRSFRDNTAGIAAWLDAREPSRGGDLTRLAGQLDRRALGARGDDAPRACLTKARAGGVLGANGHGWRKRSPQACDLWLISSPLADGPGAAPGANRAARKAKYPRWTVTGWLQSSIRSATPVGALGHTLTPLEAARLPACAVRTRVPTRRPGPG